MGVVALSEDQKKQNKYITSLCFRIKSTGLFSMCIYKALNNVVFLFSRFSRLGVQLYACRREKTASSSYCDNLFVMLAVLLLLFYLFCVSYLFYLQNILYERNQLFWGAGQTLSDRISVRIRGRSCQHQARDSLQ